MHVPEFLVARLPWSVHRCWERSFTTSRGTSSNLILVRRAAFQHQNLPQDAGCERPCSALRNLGANRLALAELYSSLSVYLLGFFFVSLSFACSSLHSFFSLLSPPATAQAPNIRSFAPPAAFSPLLPSDQQLELPADGPMNPPLMV